MAATSTRSNESPEQSPSCAEPSNRHNISTAPSNIAKRHGGLPNGTATELLTEATHTDNVPDAFETNEKSDEDDSSDVLEPGRGSIDLDELPIELVSLTDR